MACCSARRVTGRAWEGNGPGRPFLVELLLLVVGLVLGSVGIALVFLLLPFTAWARRQRVRFVAAVTDSWKASVNRLLDTPFLVDPTRRCRVSSSLYGWSKPAAGFVFRYFNVLLLWALAGIAALGGAAGVFLFDL